MLPSDTPATEIAGAVHARRRIDAERVGHEALGGELRAVEVARASRRRRRCTARRRRRSAPAGGRSSRTWIWRVRDRPADRESGRRRDRRDRRSTRRWSRSGRTCSTARPCARRSPLASSPGSASPPHSARNAGDAAPARLDQQPPGRGRRLHHRRAVLLEQRAQGVAVRRLLAGREHDLGADRERQHAARAPRCRTTAWSPRAARRPR